MTSYIKKLPAVFQTITEKKFFDATFDQVFSKKDSDLLFGYLGQRIPGKYDPVNDFYLPEPSKDRTWWQLEATAFAREPDTTKTNVFFYDDLLNRINYYGGNTLNQDRLFESEYYSWAPPIDFDMFTNYQNYYWVEQGLVTINITGVLASDIIGKDSFTTPATSTPANLTLTTGMKVMLVDDPLHTEPLTVENIGNCVGIILVPQFTDITAGTILEFLPWDGTIELATGRLINNPNWDTLTWDVQPQPGNSDYITIERGSTDKNAWSRTNKWFHIDAINATVQATGTSFPTNATRALRPIIQFTANLTLYKSGTQFKDTITYGFNNDQAGDPILLSQLQGKSYAYIDALLGVQIQDGDIVVFFNDTTSEYAGPVEKIIYKATITGGIVSLYYHSSVITGDIVVATASAPNDGAQRGQSWFYDGDVWAKVYNDKVSTNQPPLFQLYDHNYVPLDDENTYPFSTFTGSKIFSYKVNTAPGASADPVLKFPIVYTSLGQASDILFQNNLITDRYTYTVSRLPVNGYYYYKTTDNPVYFNNWNLYTPCPCDNSPVDADCIALSKQRVIDKYVVGYGTQYQFKLSVVPYGYPVSPDLVVSVDGYEIKHISLQTNGYTFVTINNSIYVDLQDYLTNLLLVTPALPPVVEINTYTHGLLDPAATGYYEIPQQLDANPSQLEISEISASNLIEQFSSIIQNQVGFTGVAFGGNNNYRDSKKNRSTGSFILQNIAPVLKSMLVSSSDDLDVIAGIRFSQDEYTKFKNKYLRTALQLINQEFNPVQYHNNTIVISAWVDEILKTVNISKEFSNAFAYSYMIANGTPVFTENVVVPANGLISLSNYVDLSDSRNALYIYDVTGQETLLLITQDYEIVSSNLSIELFIKPTVAVGSNLSVAFYKNPLPAYIPSTPTKIGAYNAYIPSIELDTTYAIPTNVIIGHDGSKTIAYGDYRDQLLLELEKRIYNLLQFKFRDEYYLPLRLEDVKSGYFRETRYSRDEYLNITESYINKWSSKNKANYRVNDWDYLSTITPVNQLWKLYNYSSAINSSQVSLNLPGNWKGIFQYYYDTIHPDTCPWEMLGFSMQPSWWTAEYGNGITNTYGQTVWPSTASAMWDDLEAGIIRQGASAIYDPVTLLPVPQIKWARPGLSAVIPVDSAGEIIPVPTLFDVLVTSDPYEPFDHFNDAWAYGDGAPVEQAWMSTSAYVFSIQEFLYLMRPGPFGELMWDTVGTELSPGKITVPSSAAKVMSTANWQYVQNDIFTNADPFFPWMRPKNSDQVVHAEIVNGTVQIRYGYQRWISDRIMFLNKNVADVFGQKIRTLDVNLANKLAGFTNKDTTTTYIESVSTSATTTSLSIPTNNFDVLLHKGQPIKTYSYSGVVIRALADGKFVVYGYDLLHSEFIVMDRSDKQLIDITIGGTPSEYKLYAYGETYNIGDIVRYNGVYYVASAAFVAGKFDPKNWQKLKALPTIGGVSVTYRPISEATYTTVPYGTVLGSVQEVFDLLIGWGAYLELEGWQFTDVNQATNQISDWLYCAKQYLFWLNTNWAPDASIQLSPAANSATLIVKTGYPDDVESISNGIYSILDKFGVAIPPTGTTTDRDGLSITVAPVDLSVGGIYFLQVNASETEHILIFDNSTSFDDVVYDPLLRARQQRLRFNGFRSNGWYGKMEAPGYLIIDNQLVPNYDTIVEAMRYYYDPDVTIDNPSLEDLGRHLIGYESKSYLDNLQVSNDVQYLFYQGAIRQKGTIQAFNKLFRSTKVQSNETIEVFEEWALKLGNFGNTVEQVSTEFILKPEQNSGEVIVARLNYVPSVTGSVKQINILNAEVSYDAVPRVIISLPDYAPEGSSNYFDDISYINGSIVRYDDTSGAPVYYVCNTPCIGILPTNTAYWSVYYRTVIAKAYAVLDATGVISRIDITDPGVGYVTAPLVEINSGSQINTLDRFYAVWQGDIVRDDVLDNVVDIDIDDTNVWTVRPLDAEYSLEFPVTDNITYSMPNAGYVNFNDVDWTAFNVSQTALKWGTSLFNPVESDTIWIAKTFTEDWDVCKMVNITPANADNSWKVIEDAAGNLVLLLAAADVVVPTMSVNEQDPVNITTKLVNGHVSSITVENGGFGYVGYTTSILIDAPTTPGGQQAYAMATVVGGAITSVTITDPGSGYTSVPNVSAPVFIYGTPATLSASIAYGATIDSVVSPGGFFVAPPVLTFDGSPTTPMTATAALTNGAITGITVTSTGSGYTTPPNVTVSSPAPVVPAVLTPVVNSNGGIGSVIINNGGSGYTPNATVIVNRLSLDPSYVDAVIVITDVGPNGEITSISVTSPGTGYGLESSNTLLAQLSASPVNRTDFGNMICLQIVKEITDNAGNVSNVVDMATNYAVTFEADGEYIDPAEPSSSIVYNSYNLLTLAGVPITSADIGVYSEFTDLLLFKSMRFETKPTTLPFYVTNGDKIWVDLVSKLWTVFTYTTAPAPTLTAFRSQLPLIDTSLFESSQVFDTRTGTEQVRLPIYDPFKSILPALAKQNISYTLLQDPAKYNVTGNIRSFSENITFGEAQVGRLWWDLSEVRYPYYEQPVALDGSESSADNLVYVRDHWGQIFAGSTINIYEWVRSPVPPADYTGSGIPRTTTDYVQIVTSNRFTNMTETNYYFWVLNPTDKPNVENRTLAALDVARLLFSPKSQNFAFFAPIQQTATNNSYMFYNIQEVLAYKGDSIQIKYRVATRDDQKHAQWSFFREGDPASLVTDQYWDKLVDSLCGYTKILTASDEWLNGIYIGKNLPWDIYGWDIGLWDEATDLISAVYGEILPVPDPSLSAAEKPGIQYRPRQSMFVDLYAARKVFVQAANSLLQYVPIRDNNPTWNESVKTSIYWEYTNWYSAGFENVTPTNVYLTLTQAQADLVAGRLQNGAIVEIINGTTDGRYVLYNVVQLNPNVSVQSFERVCIENSAVKLLDTLYTVRGVYSLSEELRELLDAIRTEIFVNNYIVDQNELYFSMLNYVVSEQKNPDWLFKTSYIYVKENNIPLVQTSLYIPDQISNVIDYITDAKPYHTQIRDYTSTHVVSDIAVGTASDSFKSKTILTFGPRDITDRFIPEENFLSATYGWDLTQRQFTMGWDTFTWDVLADAQDEPLTINTILNQYVSGNPVVPTYNPGSAAWPDLVPVPLTFYDASKVGLSALSPYTFDLSSINIDNPQSFITPTNVVVIKIGNTALNYGQDYYVGYNSNGTYTAYFYNNPGTSVVPVAYVMWNGGNLMNTEFDTSRNELALGYGIDNIVVNVDTKFPINLQDGLYTLINSGWDIQDTVLESMVYEMNGNRLPITDVPGPYNESNPAPSWVGFDCEGSEWDQGEIDNVVLTDDIISYKETLNVNTGAHFYRNSNSKMCTLLNELQSPTADTANLDVITVFTATDILPDATMTNPGVVWINGERIEYKYKELVSTAIWALKLVQRGTLGTMPTLQPAGSKVWVELGNEMVNVNDVIWNAADPRPDVSQNPPPVIAGEYSNMNTAPVGGLWYAQTRPADFLKLQQGDAVP